MAEIDVHDDVLEEILIRLDVKDLTRYKCVRKSWFSLITSPRFVRRHMNHSCNKHHYNNEFGQRRVSLFTSLELFNCYRLIGSSNGLVCVEFKSKLMLCNPLTREVRQLLSPPFTDLTSCWGFGYDSSTDDYKVIVGVWKGENQTCFQLLSLKSNEWRLVGEAKFKWFDDKRGVLCNGALHWMISNYDGNTKTSSIISYDLSKEEFKEIHLPNDERYMRCNLGIFKECLCMFGNYFSPTNAWLIKKCNVKESWELVKIRHDDETKYDIVHTLGLRLPNGDDASWYYSASKRISLEYMAAPVFVGSLVSPHDIARGDPKLIEDGKKGRKKGGSSWLRFACCSSVSAIN
ncbi:F-box/kelch-repeat protein At3g23880-like [Bidens hawaiensis]|uniref:F-box/kelch-repeat protein At3g23880-like n=1 Tax=Bidens hawaiensis TaxID=980011 RepID=UPI004049452B